MPRNVRWTTRHSVNSCAPHQCFFQVEVSDDLMLLTYERCCMLQCQKVTKGRNITTEIIFRLPFGCVPLERVNFQISSADMTDEEPYSFLGALEEGYFSDLTLTAASGKEVDRPLRCRLKSSVFCLVFPPGGNVSLVFVLFRSSKCTRLCCLSRCRRWTGLRVRRSSWGFPKTCCTPSCTTCTPSHCLEA